jgi:MFS family permease
MTQENAPPAAPRPWLTASVLGFGLASLFSDLGHEAATAALPALLATIGAAPAALGVIEGLSDGIVSFAKLAGGSWADRPRLRKPLCVGGYLATGLATGLFALATSWLHILLVRSIGWFARGIRGPARDAMLSDAVPEEAVGRAFGFHRAMDTAGAVIGPALATVLVVALPLRSVFLWTLVPGILAAVAFGLLVKRQEPHPLARPQRFWKKIGALPAPFRRFLVAVFLFGMGDFARSLLILRAIQLLAPSMGPERATATAMALYVGHNVIYAAAAYPVGRLADAFAPKTLLVVGYVLGIVTAGLAALATASLWMLAALFAVAGLVLAFEDTLEGAITAKAVDPAARGTAYGVLAATNGVGDLVSSSLVGLLWTAFSPELAFGVAALLCLAGTLVLGVAQLARPTDSAAPTDSTPSTEEP